MFTNIWGALDGAKLRKRFDERLDIRAPEDMFATDEQVREKFRRPIEQPHLDEAIDGLLRAWLEGDRDRATTAAEEVERRTRAHFQAQGVPVFAHPILPPQFVRSVHEQVDNLPTRERGAAMGDLVTYFRESLRPAVTRELASNSSIRSRKTAPREFESPVLSTGRESHAFLGDRNTAQRSRNDEDIAQFRSFATPTSEHCKANKAAWDAVVAEYEGLLDDIYELQRDRRATIRERKALEDDWERRKPNSSTDPERVRAVSALVQKESDLWKQEQDLRKKLPPLDDRKRQIRDAHMGCKGPLVDPSAPSS